MNNRFPSNETRKMPKAAPRPTFADHLLELANKQKREEQEQAPAIEIVEAAKQPDANDKTEYPRPLVVPPKQDLSPPQSQQRKDDQEAAKTVDKAMFGSAWKTPKQSSRVDIITPSPKPFPNNEAIKPNDNTSAWSKPLTVPKNHLSPANRGVFAVRPFVPEDSLKQAEKQATNTETKKNAVLPDNNNAWSKPLVIPPLKKTNNLSPAKRRGPLKTLTNAGALEDRKIESKKIKKDETTAVNDSDVINDSLERKVEAKTTQKMQDEMAIETTALNDSYEEEEVVVRESNTRTIKARVLKLHEIPEYGFQFRDIDIPVTKLNRNEYDPLIDFSTETEVLCVAPLDRGRNDEVWFAVTPDQQRCCAVKLFFPPSGTSEKQLAQSELRNWQAVYGNDPLLPKCHMGELVDYHLGDKCYLCMPYLSPSPKRYWPIIVQDPFTQPLEDALRKFASKGYKQTSMKLEHLGFFPNAGRDALYIMGLGRLEALASEESSIEEWVEESVRELRSNVPPLSICHSLPIQYEGSFDHW